MAIQMAIAGRVHESPQSGFSALDIQHLSIRQPRPRGVSCPRKMMLRAIKRRQVLPHERFYFDLFS
jgi:hypothetical protein